MDFSKICGLSMKSQWLMATKIDRILLSLLASSLILTGCLYTEKKFLEEMEYFVGKPVDQFYTQNSKSTSQSSLLKLISKDIDPDNPSFQTQTYIWDRECMIIWRVKNRTLISYKHRGKCQLL